MYKGWPGIDERQEYVDMRRNTQHFYCWLCGRRESDRPSWWGAQWLIERAHIVNKPRALDRRAVVLLCSACHRRQHGDRIAGDHEGIPVLALPELMLLKLLADGEWYDEDFLQKHVVGLLPEIATSLPKEAVDVFTRRVGTPWMATVSIVAESISIALPIPPISLSPNSRYHWAVRARDAATMRLVAKLAAKDTQIRGKQLWARATVEITVYSRLHRKRDGDNYLARMKSCFDGLQDAGVVVDDCGIIYLPITFRNGGQHEWVELKISQR